jgi:hypothetical protein
MQIEKRTMNWLPRASLYDEAETNRVKRKTYAQQAMAQSSSATGLISGSISTSGDAVNLTLRIAAQRVQAGVNVKPKG